MAAKTKGGEEKGNRENKKQDVEIMEAGDYFSNYNSTRLRFLELLLCFAKNEAS